CLDRAVVFEQRLAKSRQVLGPGVEAAEYLVDIGIVGIALAADDEALVERGLHGLDQIFVALVLALFLHLHVAEIVDARDLALLLDGQRKEALRLGERAVDQRLRHTMVLEIEEADRLGCFTQSISDRTVRAGFAREAGTDVDDRNFLDRI